MTVPTPPNEYQKLVDAKLCGLSARYTALPEVTRERIAGAIFRAIAACRKFADERPTGKLMSDVALEALGVASEEHET